MIQLAPSNIEAFSALGGLYASQHRLDEARAEFETLAGRNPKSVTPATMVATIFYLQGKPDDARRWFEKVMAIDPRAPVAANNLAWIYAQSDGNLDVALQLAQTAKAQLQDRPEVDDTLGWIYYKKGLASLAVTQLEQSVARQPGNPIYQYHLGLAYAKAGASDRARLTLHRALQLKLPIQEVTEAQRVLVSLKG